MRKTFVLVSSFILLVIFLANPSFCQYQRNYKLVICGNADVMYAGYNDVIYNASKGFSSMRNVLKSSNLSSIATDGNLVYVSCGKDIYSSNGSTVKKIYTGDKDITAIAANKDKVFAAIGNTIYFVSGRETGIYGTIGEGKITGIYCNGDNVFAAVLNKVFVINRGDVSQYYTFGEGQIQLISGKGDFVYVLIGTTLYTTDGSTGSSYFNIARANITSIYCAQDTVFFTIGKEIFYKDGEYVKSFVVIKDNFN